LKTLRTQPHLKLVSELKKVRKEAGFTQADLAAELGVHQSWVAKTENGERRLDVVEFVSWLQACRHLEEAQNIANAIAEIR